MSDPSSGRPASPPVRPAAALAYATVGFVALLIAGFGLTSLFTDADVIGVSGLGSIPGAVGVVASTAAFAVVTWLVVRVRHPSFGPVAAVAPAAFLAYLAGVWVGAVATGTDLARAGAAVGGFTLSPFAIVLLGAAFAAGWAAVALVRTRAHRPHWPWEDDDEED